MYFEHFEYPVDPQESSNQTTTRTEATVISAMETMEQAGIIWNESGLPAHAEPLLSLNPAERKFAKLTHELFTICVGATLTQPERVDKRKYIDRVIREAFPWDANKYAENELLFEDIVTAAERITTVQGIAADVTMALREDMQDEPAKRFTFAQLLGSPTLSDLEPSQQALLRFTVLDEQRSPRNGIIREVVHGLHSGEFASDVARVVLTDAANTLDVKPGKKDDPLVPVRHLIRQARQYSGDGISTVIDKLSAQDMLPHWYQASPAITRYQDRLLSAIGNNHKALQAELKDNWVLIPPLSQKEFDQAARNLNLRYSRAIEEAWSLPRTKLDPLEQAEIEVAKKRQRLLGKLALDGDHDLSQHKESIPHQKNLLYVMNSRGDLAGDKNPHFESAIYRQVKQLRRDSRFKADIKRCLEFLEDVNFSEGQVNGIEKISDLVVSRGGIKYDVYKLKPKEANNLSMGSVHGEKIRVLFVRPKAGSLAIIGVVLRPKLEQFLKSMRSPGSTAEVG
jgi:hypothetical protein